MSDLRDLLNAAAPEPAELDVARIEHRVASRRRRRAVALGLGVALVAGSSGAVMVRDGDRDPGLDVTAGKQDLEDARFAPGITRWPLPGAFEVALGGGAVWAAATVEGAPAPGQTRIVRLDPATGTSTAERIVDGTPVLLAADDQATWAVVRSRERDATGDDVYALDPSSAEVDGSLEWCGNDDSLRSTDCLPLRPRQLLVVGGKAWVRSDGWAVAFDVDGARVDLRVTTRDERKETFEISSMVSHGREVWAQDSNRLARFDLESREIVATEPWEHGQLLAVGGDRLWTMNDRDLLELFRGDGQRPPLEIPVTPTAIAADAAGAWVATAGQIARYDRDGTLVPGSEVAEAGVTELAGTSTAVWFVPQAGGEIVRFSLPAPVPTDTATPPAEATTVTTTVTTVGSCSIVELSVPGAPGDIEAQNDGSIWYTAPDSHAVVRVKGSEAVTYALPGDAKPGQIVSGEGEEDLWFTDWGRSSIWRITAKGDVDEFRTPTRSSNAMGPPGQGSNPAGIAVGPDGNIWFTESLADVIGRITPEGEITEYPLPDRDRVHANPWAITGGHDDAVWFTKQLTNELGRLDPATGTMSVVPLSAGSGAGMVGGGSSLDFAPDGRFWMDKPRGSVMATTPSGNVSTYAVFSEPASITSVVADSSGRVWVADAARGRLAHLAVSNGKATEVPLPPGPANRMQGTAGGATASIDVLDEGSVWVSQPTAGRIAHLDCP